jgi:hypothetical protein
MHKQREMGANMENGNVMKRGCRVSSLLAVRGKVDHLGPHGLRPGQTKC